MINEKKRLKLAEIRRNGQNPCPFGLPIPFGCKHSGNHINKLAPLDIMGKDSSDTEKEIISKANTKLLAWNLLHDSRKTEECPYVGHLFDEKEVVECNYEDSAPGEPPVDNLLPPSFYHTMFNTTLLGLHSFPIGYYSDYNVSRNLYYGMYSAQGYYHRQNNQELFKLAADTDGLRLTKKYTNKPE